MALQQRVSAEVARTRRMVTRRLSQEINYQYLRQAEAGRPGPRGQDGASPAGGDRTAHRRARTAPDAPDGRIRPGGTAAAAAAGGRVAGARRPPGAAGPARRDARQARRPLHQGHQARSRCGRSARSSRPNGRWAGNRRSSRTATPASTSGPGIRWPGHTVFIEVKGRAERARRLHRDQDRGRARQERRPLPARPGLSRFGGRCRFGGRGCTLRDRTVRWDRHRRGLRPALGYPALARLLASWRGAR